MVTKNLAVFFARFDRPWLAALASIGAAWFVISFPLGLLGKSIHPMFNVLGGILNLLGAAVLLVSGMIFSILWWRQYLDWKFFSGPGDDPSSADRYQ